MLTSVSWSWGFPSGQTFRTYARGLEWIRAVRRVCAAPDAAASCATDGVVECVFLLGECAYVCKRDARVYVDNLKLPVELRPFFGRPAVRAGDLARFGNISCEELAGLFTYVRVFSYGFSWRCCVA